MMATTTTAGQSSSVTDEAWSWVARLDDLSTSDRMTLQRWLEESEVHRREFEAVRREWRSLGFLQLLQTDAAKSGDPWVARNWVRRERARRFSLPLAAAATLVVAVLTIWWALPLDFRADYVTAVGEQQEFPLPDDSVVLLNTNTRLTVQFTDDERTVILERGEANFQVAHETERPFVVLAGAGVVRAVGTAFNVNVSTDGVEVTVTDGEVELAQRRERSNTTTAITVPIDTGSSPGSVHRLAAGHNARITNSIEPVTAVDPDILERKLAWQHGMLEFVNAPLSEVIAEAGRYTTNSLMITDPELEAHRVTITARASDIDGLLRILDASNSDIEVTHEPENKRVLISRL